MDELAAFILDLAQKKGAALVDIFFLNSRELTIEVAKQEIENLKLAEEQGCGLRLISGNKLGYAYSANLGKKALTEIVESALQNSQFVIEDSAWEVAEPVVNYRELDLFDPQIIETPLEEKIALAQGLEKAAFDTDTRIRQVEKAVYQDSNYSISIFNSRGLKGHYHGAYCGLYGIAIAQDSTEAQTGFNLNFSPKYNDLNPLKIGQKAAQKAVQMLGAQTMPSARLPVVLEPYVLVGILGILQTAFSGEAVLKGTSFLAEKEGEEIASPLVNIIDHGFLPGQLGSAPFDGEGTPTQKTILVENGVLQGFLHNLYTANKNGITSTGNAIRNSYKFTPEVGTTNFYLAPGNNSPQELLREIKHGLYVTEVMGLHMANPISGDFSLGASGLLIENGELTRPIKGIALAGDLQGLLRGINHIANDLTFYMGQGAPTVRIEGLAISG